MAGGEIFDQLLCRSRDHRALVNLPTQSRLPGGIAPQMRRDVRAQSRHRFRKLVAAPWCFAKPEWNRRRHAVRILDAHNPALDALDPIALVAELEDVAGEALHCEILIHSPDEIVLRFE